MMCYPRGSRAVSKYVDAPKFSPQAVRKSSQASLQKSYECTPPESLAGGLKVTLIKLKAEQWNYRGRECHCCVILSSYLPVRSLLSPVRAVKRQLCIPSRMNWHNVASA